MQFTKMQGIGNDYIYINGLDGALDHGEHLPELARRMSDRHFGIGGDGLIVVGAGTTGDFSMRMFNADGSRGEMCGNGIRCLAKYVYDKGLTQKIRFVIDTDAGPRRLLLHREGQRVTAVTVNMGSARVHRPMLSISTDQATYQGLSIQIGNPHFVIFCQNPDEILLDEIGPFLENHPLFPQKTNVEFVHVTEDGFQMRVWERGSGETLACGTGACAAFAAARARNLCGSRVTAHLKGGALQLVQYPDGHIEMTGPAVTVFEGEWPEDD